MKILSVPVVLLLALAATLFTSTEFSRDPDTGSEDWVSIRETRTFRPGIRDVDVDVLVKQGVPRPTLDREVRGGEKPMTMGAFLILRREVSRAEYALFLKSKAGADVSPPAGWPGRAPKAEERDLPATGVTRANAAAYAAWRNGRLPSEWEWEYAMRRQTGNYYPWGNVFDGHKAVTSTGGPVATDDDRYRVGDFWHASGNVAEWTSSDIEGGGAQSAVVRGGSYRGRSHQSRLTAREGVDPGIGHAHVGFRIVKDS